MQQFEDLEVWQRSRRWVDLGLLSMSKTGTLSGLALVAGLNRVTGDMPGGAAFSAVNWHGGRDSGVNGAFVNVLNDTEKAFNVGFVTVAKGQTGVDLGGFNFSSASSTSPTTASCPSSRSSTSRRTDHESQRPQGSKGPAQSGASFR
jgi:hypothetical protein